MGNRELSRAVLIVICQIHLEMDLNSLVLEAAFIGKSKEMIDSTAFDIDLLEVIHIFCTFLRYIQGIN